MVSIVSWSAVYRNVGKVQLELSPWDSKRRRRQTTGVKALQIKQNIQVNQKLQGRIKHRITKQNIQVNILILNY